jgi:CDP-paratose 2-epimerase
MGIKTLKKRYEWTGKISKNIWREGITEKDGKISINEKFTIDGYGKYGHSIYGIDKLCGELLVQEWGMEYKIPTVIFRMSCIYGLFQKGVCEQAWVDFFLRKIMLEDGSIPIFGTGKQVRDVLDGRDAARAYLDSLENIDKVKGEIFTLGGGQENTYSLLEAIEVIEELTGNRANLSFHPKRPHDQDIYISSIKKIKEKLRWKPMINFEDAIVDMINQYEK